MIGGKGRNWTTKEEQILRDLFAQELPIIHIAERLNRSVLSIQTRLSRLQLKVNQGKRKLAEDRFVLTKDKINKNQYRWTSEHIEQLRILWQSNLSVRAIALQFQRSPSAIRRAANLYLGAEMQRNNDLIKHAPKHFKKCSRLEYWNNLHAQEQAAWLKMVKAKTREEKAYYEQAWKVLQYQESVLLSQANVENG